MSRVVLVNPLSLLGTELRQSFSRHRGRWSEIKLATSAAEHVGTLTEAGGSAALVEAFAPDEVAGWELVVVCGEPVPGAEHLARLGPETTVLFAGDTRPATALPVVAGVNLHHAVPGLALASPAPAVVLLASLLKPLVSLGLTDAVASILLPASDREQAGLDELLEQTRSILAFRSERPRDVFGEQLAFNLLPSTAPSTAWESELSAVLESETRIAVQAVQAGVFHSVSASVWVRLADPTDPERARRAIEAAPAIESFADAAALGPVAAASRQEILLGSVRGDDARRDTLWIWAVMDNLTRGGALNVLAAAEALFGDQP